MSELLQAEQLFKEWKIGRRPYGARPAGECPHEDYPCTIPGGRECLGKIVWWRRYLRQIEASA